MRFFVLVSIWSICCWSMDDNNLAYEMTLAEPSKDHQLIDSCKQQLALQCDSYLVYLEKIFGCDLCKVVNAVFNARAYEHSEMRKKQLKHLKAILTTDSDESPKHFRTYLVALNFKGTMGKSFLQSCLNTIKLYVPYLQDDEDSACIVCMDKSRAVIAFPCAHYQSCETCFKETLVKSKYCSSCRSKITSYRVLPKGVVKCTLCQVNVANIMTRKCGHIAICDSCAGQEKIAECPICFLKDQLLIKVFY